MDNGENFAPSRFVINYVYGRGDYVAMSMALAQQSWLKRLQIVMLINPGILFALGLLAIWRGVDVSSIPAILLGLPIWYWLFLAAVNIFIVFLPWVYTAPLAAMIHRYNATHDAEVELIIDENGFGSKVARLDMEGRFGWQAVERLVETKKGLFVAISKREALAIPRRAVSTQHSFDALRAFIRSKVKDGTPYDVY